MNYAEATRQAVQEVLQENPDSEEYAVVMTKKWFTQWKRDMAVEEAFEMHFIVVRSRHTAMVVQIR